MTPRAYRTVATIGLAVVILLCGPAPVMTHGDGQILGGFQSGFLHPISGLDHVLAMVAVGLWGAQLGPPQVWLLPLAIPLVLKISFQRNKRRGT